MTKIKMSKTKYGSTMGNAQERANAEEAIATQKKTIVDQKAKEKAPRYKMPTDLTNLTHVLDKNGKPLVSPGKQNPKIKLPRY